MEAESPGTELYILVGVLFSVFPSPIIMRFIAGPLIVGRTVYIIIYRSGKKRNIKLPKLFLAGN